jgi:hypothetical protein
MYLNAERIARLNQAVQDTFEQTSIAWQAIPHWDTGDPGQLRVRVDYSYESAAETEPGLAAPLGGKSVELSPESVRFAVTVAQATAPTPDALLDAVIARTVKLAAQVDGKVIAQLAPDQAQIDPTTAKIEDLLNTLIDARALLENSGYRAPSCLLTDTAGLKSLNQIEDGLPQLQLLLDAANINSLYRTDNWGDQGKGNDTGKAGDAGKSGDAGKAGDAGNKGNGQSKGRLLLIGRRQRIAHGGAGAASPGEEPVDLAVSVAPSLEIVGETNQGNIELAVRIRFAPRLTDKRGIIGVTIS